MKRILPVLFLAILAFGVTEYLDILYYPEIWAPQPDKNKLDIYVPDGLVGTAPVLFFVHGGTWMYNDRSDFSGLGYLMADSEDLITVIPSYRLSDSLHPEVVHPDHIEDIAEAFVWVKENIASYGGDPDQIIVFGHSAGGHLATLLTTNTSYLEAAGGDVDDVLAMVCMCMGVYDIPKLYDDAGMYAPLAWPYTPFGQIFSDDEDVWIDASPRYHLHDNMPPSVFFVANEDMEHIIGGDWFDMGMVFLDGEVQFCYDHYNEYQPTDTFWIDGDHDTSFYTFATEPSSRARILVMDFINDALMAVEEKQVPQQMSLSAYPNPFNSALEITGQGYIEIFDAQGKQVFQGTLPTLWQPQVGSGLYIVRSETETQKVYFIK